MIKTKKSQSEVVTTVLLVLLSIAAVVLVSTFVINMVRQNLKDSDCFQTVGQLEIRMDEGYTYYNSTEKSLYLNIARGTKEFNISAINVIYGTEATSKSKKLSAGTITDTIYFYNVSGKWDNVHALVLPEPGETAAYKINVTSTYLITHVAVSVALDKGSECEKADEKTITAY